MPNPYLARALEERHPAKKKAAKKTSVGTPAAKAEKSAEQSDTTSTTKE